MRIETGKMNGHMASMEGEEGESRQRPADGKEIHDDMLGKQKKGFDPLTFNLLLSCAAQ
jgi:hypothetical protein